VTLSQFQERYKFAIARKKVRITSLGDLTFFFIFVRYKFIIVSYSIKSELI